MKKLWWMSDIRTYRIEEMIRFREKVGAAPTEVNMTKLHNIVWPCDEKTNRGYSKKTLTLMA